MTATPTAPATRITPGLAGAPTDVDLVVIGLGVTGAGVALDAVTRGLSVLALDAHDLAWGTSRFSSKLVHGGLRYLASGQIGVARESAVERGILIERTAPHLVHAVPSLIPLGGATSRSAGLLARAGFAAGDLLRRTAGTSADTLPRPRHLTAAEVRRLAPPLRTAGLRGGLLGWDGQLEDDARLVTTIARTAALRGAAVRTRARVLSASGREVVVRDELTGAETVVTARAVVNAAGVWAADLEDSVHLRPSRGTHLVLRESIFPGLDVVVFVPVPGEFNRFVMVLPQPDGRVYVGLTDEPVDGPVPDVATPSDAEIDFLLSVVSTAVTRPVTREDVVGAFAGLRPLLDAGTGTGESGKTADLSRRHAVITGRSGMVTIVGGKLTTYRKMAQDAVDAAIAASGLSAGPCVTRSLPLAGAAPRIELDRLRSLAGSVGEERLIRRFGADAGLVLASAREATGLGDDELLAPVADGIATIFAELVFGVTHEGAADVDDLLDRRTRIGLVPADRLLAVPAAERALELVRSRG